jgi:2-dehydropantoate 2-reductase
VEALAAAVPGAEFQAVASDQILLVMWEKWVFLAPLTGITCLAWRRARRGRSCRWQ